MDPVSRVWNSLSPKPTDFQLVQHGRRLLKEGQIKFYNTEEKKLKDRQFFLFNDILLLCMIEGDNKFRLRYLISLQDSVKVEDETTGWSDFRVVSPGSDVPNVEFRISTNKKNLVFFARHAAEKNEWVSLIRSAVQNAV